MVIAGVVTEESSLQRLKSIGVKDSKLLSREKREELFEKIKNEVKGYKIIIIPPKEIDDALNSNLLNLNWLEAHKSAEIINSLNPERAIIDSPSNNCREYTRYIKKLLHSPQLLRLICVHKADILYPEVSAASILAKVSRDREMEKLEREYGSTGPGYMSNEVTRKFLEENWEKHPEIFRQSWIPYRNHKQAKFQKRLGEFESFIREK